jgi:hypothetical protein
MSGTDAAVLDGHLLRETPSRQNNGPFTHS